MRRDPHSFLWDARHSADAILRFTEGKSGEDYLAEDMLRAAVERHFEILGEALNQFAKIDPATAASIPELSRAVAFRNLLIHGYATVDDATVWRTARVDLPAMREAIDRALASLEGDPS